ncbi:RidA family protein [bacterium]|nr:RidA family protein [bacterium]
MTVSVKSPSNGLINQRILVNPKGTEAIYDSMQFSQAVRVGNMVWVSGQVGMDESFQMGEGIEAQARMAFQNLERVINEAGGTLADIVEIVTYHTSMNDMHEFSKVKLEFIPENYPAWTAVGVTELVIPGLLIEIRATAIVKTDNR